MSQNSSIISHHIKLLKKICFSGRI